MRHPRCLVWSFFLLLTLLHASVLSAGVQVCNTWNERGAITKLRDYPGLAGPIRVTQPGNYSGCYSLTLNMSELAPGYEQTKFLVLMGVWGNQPSEPSACNSSFEAILAAFADDRDSFATDISWTDVLNENQVPPQDYQYRFNDGWYQCCDTNKCNKVVNPPSYRFNTSIKNVHSCRQMDSTRGWRFYTDPSIVLPSEEHGNFTDCFSYTVELERYGKVLYTVAMGGYDPDEYDGNRDCMGWVNKTLNAFESEGFYTNRFGFNYTSAWGSCCSVSNCNNIVLPPGSGSHRLRLQFYFLAMMLIAMTIMNI